MPNLVPGGRGDRPPSPAPSSPTCPGASATSPQSALEAPRRGRERARARSPRTRPRTRSGASARSPAPTARPTSRSWRPPASTTSSRAGRSRPSRPPRDSGSHLLVIGAHDGAAGGTRRRVPAVQALVRAPPARRRQRRSTREPARAALRGPRRPRRSCAPASGPRWSADDWPVPGTRWRTLHLDARAQRLGARRSTTARSRSSAPADGHDAVGADGAEQHLRHRPVHRPRRSPTTQQMNLTEATSLTYTTPPLVGARDVGRPGGAEGAAEEHLAGDRHRRRALRRRARRRQPPGGGGPAAVARSPSIDRSRSVTDRRPARSSSPTTTCRPSRPSPPGQARDYHVEFWPIGNRFERGHRIRLTPRRARRPASCRACRR